MADLGSAPRRDFAAGGSRCDGVLFAGAGECVGCCEAVLPSGPRRGLLFYGSQRQRTLRSNELNGTEALTLRLFFVVRFSQRAPLPSPLSSPLPSALLCSALFSS